MNFSIIIFNFFARILVFLSLWLPVPSSEGVAVLSDWGCLGFHTHTHTPTVGVSDYMLAALSDGWMDGWVGAFRAFSLLLTYLNKSSEHTEHKTGCRRTKWRIVWANLEISGKSGEECWGVEWKWTAKRGRGTSDSWHGSGFDLMPLGAEWRKINRCYPAKNRCRQVGEAARER